MSLETILSQEMIQRLGWTLLHFVWQATAVMLLLAFLLAGLRKVTANVRYIIACAALGLIVLLPIATIMFVPVSTPPSIIRTESPSPPVAVSVQPIIEDAPVGRVMEFEEPVKFERTDTAPAVPWKQRAIEKLDASLPYLVAGWLIGVFGLSLWHLGGWAQLQQLKKHMVKPVDASLQAKLNELAARLNVHRAVQLVESALVQVPTVVGWLCPVILLPASALTGLSTEQLEALLAHELAHIRRYDYLVNMLQTIVETLGFYHPGVWWVSHKIRAERENCCDDLAVSLSGDRVLYARALTSMEEIRAGRSELAVAATGGNLFERIRRLVGKEASDSNRAGWIPSVITILLIAMIVIPTTLALTAHNDTELSVQSLLDKMLEHRSRVRNLEYVVESQIWHAEHPTDELIKRFEDRAKKMQADGASRHQIRFTEGAIGQLKIGQMQNPNKDYFEILKCTLDHEGRSKMERTLGSYDASGAKVLDDASHIRAWNGSQSVELRREGSGSFKATIKDVPTTFDHLWGSFTDYFCRCLAETIEAQRDVSVEKLMDGTYHLAFDYKVNDKVTRRVEAVIDPSKGYTCTQYEFYHDGQLSSRHTATYEKVTQDIWFPVSAQLEVFSNGSLNYKKSSTSRDIKINGPAFNANTFDVDMPDGTTVTNEVLGKQYIAGSKHTYDLDKSQKPSAKTQEIYPVNWQDGFNSFYRLEEGEVLQRIAPPYIPEREGYFKSIQPGRFSSNSPSRAVRFVFQWDGNLNIRNSSTGGSIPRLSSILGSVIRLRKYEYDIPRDLLSMDMSGDWIVRKDTPQEELLHALEPIIKEETGRDVTFVKRQAENEMIVVRGQYRFTPLPDAKPKDAVHLYTDKMDAYYDVQARRMTLSDMLRSVERRIGIHIIDETQAGNTELSSCEHYAMMLFALIYNKQLYRERVDMLLNNLSRQTGLTFKRETVTVEKWFVEEQGRIHASQKADTDARTFVAKPQRPTGALMLEGFYSFGEGEMYSKRLSQIFNEVQNQIKRLSTGYVNKNWNDVSEGAIQVRDAFLGLEEALEVDDDAAWKAFTKMWNGEKTSENEVKIVDLARLKRTLEIFAFVGGEYHEETHQNLCNSIVSIADMANEIHKTLRTKRPMTTSPHIEKLQADWSTLTEIDGIERLLRSGFQTKEESEVPTEDSGGNVGSNQVVLKLVDPNSQPVTGARIGTYVDWSDIAENPPIWFLRYGRNHTAVNVKSDEHGKVTLEAEEIFGSGWTIEGKAPLTAIDAGHYLAGLRELSRENLGKEVTLTLQPGCRVRGRVTAATARQHKWSRNTLTVYVDWNVHRPCQYSSREGRFEFILPPGEYKVKVYADDPDKAVILPIRIQPGQRNLDLTKYLDGTSLPPAVEQEHSIKSEEGSIEGRIIDIPTGRGISGVLLAATPGSSSASDERFTCTSGKDGAFAIRDLKNGEYLLQGNFPSVNVDVVSGQCTRDVLIGVDRRKPIMRDERESIEEHSDTKIKISTRVIEMPADAMQEAFESDETLSSELLVRNGYDIVDRLLTLTDERKDAKLIVNPHLVMFNNHNATLTSNERMRYISGYESVEGEPGKLTPQHKMLKAGWKYKIHAGLLDSGEKIHIELAVWQQTLDFETRQYQPGYEYQIPSPPDIFATEMTAKSSEPVVIGRLRHDETAQCLILTPSVIWPERQPEPLLGKKLPAPDNMEDIEALKQAEGKRILVCFWDMNQRPSRNLIDQLAKREKKLAEKNVIVLLVHTSGVEPVKLKEWLDNHNIPFACGHIEGDNEKVLFNWGVRAQPWLILTDKEGIVRAEGFSLEQLDEKLGEEIESDKVVLKLVDPNSQPIADAGVGTYVDWSDIAENPPIWFLRSGRNYITADDKSDEYGKVTLEAEGLFGSGPKPKEKSSLTAIDEGHDLAGLRELTREDLGKEVTLRMEPGCRVRGRITAAIARKYKWSTKTLTVYVDWREHRPCQYSSKQGRFELILPPGTYKVMIYSDDPDKAVILPIRIKPGQRELDLTKYIDGSSKPPAIETENLTQNEKGEQGKALVKVNCLVAEIWSTIEMDRETTIAIENVLKPGRVIVRDARKQSRSSDVNRSKVLNVLGQTAQATANVEDASGGQKRVTQEQLDSLVEMLVDRGFLKIMMNPTLRVVEGQTAQIKTDQSSLEVTVKRVKDDLIDLYVKADLSSQVTPEDQGQKSMKTMRSFTDTVRINSGQSIVIGGMVPAVIRADAQTSQPPAKEIVCILTASLIDTPPNPKNETDGPEQSTNNRPTEWGVRKTYDIADLLETCLRPSDLVRHITERVEPESWYALNKTARGRITIYPGGRANKIAIVQTPENHSKIERLLEEVRRSPDELKKAKFSVMIETRILTAGDAFMRQIGLDPNAVADSENWTNHLVHASDDSASFIIDPLHADLILKAAMAQKGNKMLIEPRVCAKLSAMEGKTIEINDHKNYYAVTPPKEPNAPSGESDSQSNRIKLGTTVRLTPYLLPDGKTVELDFEWEHRQLTGFKKHTGPDKKTQKIPQIAFDRIQTICPVPDGKTLLIAGKKITEQIEVLPKVPILQDLPLIGILFNNPTKIEETKNLLILVKPEIKPPRRTRAPLKFEPPEPLDPNDPLIKKLEAKLKK